MAQTESWENEKDASVDTIYEVTHAVGKNASNMRDDVLLVQYFLKKIYSKQGGHALSQPSKPMVVDGYFGPTTRSWILMFQNDVRTSGFSVCVDGRVDPPTGAEGVGSISKTTYTILHMNDAFKFRFPDIHAQMTTHPDVPAELRASLSQGT